MFSFVLPTPLHWRMKISGFKVRTPTFGIVDKVLLHSSQDLVQNAHWTLWKSVSWRIIPVFLHSFTWMRWPPTSAEAEAFNTKIDEFIRLVQCSHPSMKLKRLGDTCDLKKSSSLLYIIRHNYNDINKDNEVLIRCLSGWLRMWTPPASSWWSRPSLWPTRTLWSGPPCPSSWPIWQRR